MQGPFDPTHQRPLTFQLRTHDKRIASPKGIIFENDKHDHGDWEILNNRAFHPTGFIATLYGEWDKLKSTIAQQLQIPEDNPALDSPESLLGNGCEILRIHHTVLMKKQNAVQFQLGIRQGGQAETSVTVHIPADQFHRHLIDHQHLVRKHYDMKAYEQTQPKYFEAEYYNRALVGALPDVYEIGHFPLTQTVMHNKNVSQFYKDVWKAIDDDVFMPQGFKYLILTDFFDKLIARKYLTESEKADAEALLKNVLPPIRDYLRNTYYESPIQYKENECTRLIAQLNQARPWRAMVKITDLEKESVYQFFESIMKAQTSTTITYLLGRAFMRACYANPSQEVKDSGPKLSRVLDDFEENLLRNTKSLGNTTATHERFEGRWYFEDPAKNAVAAMGYSLPAIASVLNYYVDDLLLARHMLGQHARDFQSDSFRVKNIRKIEVAPRGKGACDFEFEIQLSSSPLIPTHTLRVQGAYYKDGLHNEAIRVIEKDSQRSFKELVDERVSDANSHLAPAVIEALKANIASLMGNDFKRLWEQTGKATQLRRSLKASLELPNVKLSAYEQSRVIMESLIAFALHSGDKATDDLRMVTAILQTMCDKQIITKNDLYNAIKKPNDGLTRDEGIRRKAKFIKHLLDAKVLKENELALLEASDIQALFNVAPQQIQDAHDESVREELRKRKAKGEDLTYYFSSELKAADSDLTAKIALNLFAAYEAPEKNPVVQGVEDISQVLTAMQSTPQLFAAGMILRGLLNSGVYANARETDFPARDKLALLTAAKAVYQTVHEPAHQKNTGVTSIGSQLLKGEAALDEQLRLAQGICLSTQVSDDYVNKFMAPKTENNYPPAEIVSNASSSSQAEQAPKRKKKKVVDVSKLAIARAPSTSPPPQDEPVADNNLVLEALRKQTHDYTAENLALLEKMRSLTKMAVFTRYDNEDASLSGALGRAETLLSKFKNLKDIDVDGIQLRLHSLKQYREAVNALKSKFLGDLSKEISNVEFQFRSINDPIISLAERASVSIANLRHLESSIATELQAHVDNLHQLGNTLENELTSAHDNLGRADDRNKKNLSDRNTHIRQSQAELIASIEQVEQGIKNKMPIEFIPVSCARILAHGIFNETKPAYKPLQDTGRALVALEHLRLALGQVNGNAGAPLNPQQMHGRLTQVLSEKKAERKKLSWFNPFSWGSIRRLNHEIAETKQQVDYFAKLFYFNKCKDAQQKTEAMSKEKLRSTLEAWIKKAEKGWFGRKKYAKQAVWAAKQLANLRQIEYANTLDDGDAIQTFLNVLREFETLMAENSDVLKYVNTLLPEAFKEFQGDLDTYSLSLQSLDNDKRDIAKGLFTQFETSSILRQHVSNTAHCRDFVSGGGSPSTSAASALMVDTRQTPAPVL